MSRYYRPRKLENLWSCLADSQERAVFIGGDLRFAYPALCPEDRGKIFWFDLSEIEELRQIEQREEGLWIGAAHTCSELAASQLVRREATALALAAESFASPQVRHRCPLGGWLLHHTARSDLWPALLALDAVVVCADRDNRREISGEEFILTDPESVLSGREIVVGLFLPSANVRSVFVKHRSAGPFAQAKLSLAVAASLDGGYFSHVRIALGSAGPNLFRATAAEGLLESQPTDYLPLLERVAYEVRRVALPNSDPLSNARYRKWSIGPLALRAFRLLLQKNTTSTSPALAAGESIH